MDNGVKPILAPGVFKKLPKQYYLYALQRCSFTNWTIEETANLLTGCVPHREMFLKGPDHKDLDAEVLANENKVRAALGKSLKLIKSRKFFGKTYIDSSNIIDWAVQNDIVVPVDLLKANGEIRRQWEQSGYTTPCLAAVEWVVKNFWEQTNLREPPNSRKIIQALLQQFPELSGTECDMIERTTRHPAARPD